MQQFQPRVRCIAAYLLILCTPFSPSYAGKPATFIDNLADRPYYLQLQTGFASDSDFGPSLIFITDQSRERTFVTNISLGSQVSDSLFGHEVDVVAFFGLQNFLENDFQPDGFGATLYWKTYKTWSPGWFPNNFAVKAGLGQGLSYVSRIPIAEIRDFAPDSSEKLVHYLEWSLQLPVGGLMNSVGLHSGEVLNNTWIGYSIFHRSTVFGLFADRGGGINYPGLVIEYVLK